MGLDGLSYRPRGAYRPTILSPP